jgi:hypothetical protein
MANFIDFHVYGWKIGYITGASGVFTGENLQYGWRFTGKSNVSDRGAIGDFNCFTSPINQIEDTDFIDTWIQKASPYTALKPPSPALQRVLTRRHRETKKASRGNFPLDFDW